MINSKHFFQGFSCIKRMDSPAIALGFCMVAIGALFKNIGFNLQESIFSTLSDGEKIFMLDHDDLYSSMLKSNDDPKKFPIHIQSLIDFCNQNNVILLRTVGVMFADTEKRVSDYVN